MAEQPTTKHHPIPGILPNQPFATAAALMVRARMEALWADRDLTLAGDTDALHDMRVSSRRLRAALDIAAPALSHHHARRLRRQTAGLTNALGAVRDRDVMIDSLKGLMEGADPLMQNELNQMIAVLADERTTHAISLEECITALDQNHYERRMQRITRRAPPESDG